MNKVVVVVEVGWVLSLRRLVLREEKSELKLDLKTPLNIRDNPL